MSCSWKLRSMSWRRLASLAPFTARDTLDLAMPALAAIAGSTRAYLRVDTPDTRISLMRAASPLSPCSCSYSGMGVNGHSIFPRCGHRKFPTLGWSTDAVLSLGTYQSGFEFVLEPIGVAANIYRDC